ncbi:MAG TPA: site-specific integrase, partial [Gammaproteobacteria bacterium]|nr:site-specific integrase [Gammaproteobacteria bacterium]
MATIMKRRRSDGQVRYQATVRKQGFSSVSKTFSRKRDAEQWSRKMESDFTMGEISQGSLVY